MVHCWKGNDEHIEDTFGFHSEEHLATYADDFVSSTCMLENGHDGDHDFVPDSDIGMTFSATAGAGAP